MPFPTRVMYGLKQLKSLINNNMSAASESIKTWCSNTFASKTHTHDAKSLGAIGYPDWWKSVALNEFPTTEIVNGRLQITIVEPGWLLINGTSNDSRDSTVLINGITVSFSTQWGVAWESIDCTFIPVTTGDVISYKQNQYIITYFPFR